MLYSNSEAIAAYFGVRLTPELAARLAPRYNISPGGPVLAVRQGETRAEATHFLWGLVPAWVKARADNQPDWRLNLFNARLETVAEKPAFRGAWRHRRCLVPADGFYEWQQRPGEKARQPVCVQNRDGGLFAIAGLWDVWHSPDGGVLQTCTLLTTQASGEFATVHARMPVILAPADHARWLACEPLVPEQVQPRPASDLRWYPVARTVNNPRAEGAGLIRPLADDEGETD